MKINGLLIDPADNVVTCVEKVEAGQPVYYRCGEKVLSVTAREEIPYCHKIALKDLAEGDEVVKSGEVIGKTLEPIGEGRWVSHLNIYSVPRDYDSEFVEEV